jgi:DNA-binding transcriptional regulator GbsR (MarR family)
MLYSFRTKTEDKELDKILSDVKGKERADFIRQALYFYIKNKNFAEQISKDISEIKELIKKQPTGINKDSMNKDGIKKNNGKKNNEEILKQMLDDFFTV